MKENNHGTFYRSSLGRIASAGTSSCSRGAAHHWWMQRATGIIGIALGFWFLYGLDCLGRLEHQEAVLWLSKPHHAILTLATVLVLLYHSFLGIRVIIEDYVHKTGLRICIMVCIRFLFLLLSLTALISVFSCTGAKI